MSTVFIGLMSGTSLDGIDGVLVDFRPAAGALQVRAHATPSSRRLRPELLALNRPGDDEIHRVALAGNRWRALRRGGRVAARAGRAGAQVTAVGCHGQTVRHRPGEFDGIGYTVQINAPALLAELCGIDVVADFRSRDVAAGGQGAPLVPAFHRALFSRPARRRPCSTSAASPTCRRSRRRLDDRLRLRPGQRPARPLVRGPRPALRRRRRLGGIGTVDARCSTRCWPSPTSPCRRRRAPGATCSTRMARGAPAASAADAAAARDIQATLAELTARTAPDAVRRQAGTAELIVCGGGAFNAT
jgi:anhydro-N-acetylmuramic acid kinase